MMVARLVPCTICGNITSTLDAQHYLLIGPYGHFGSQGYPESVYNGYPIDAAANVPIHQMIYQWFDYTLKGKEKAVIPERQGQF